MIRQVIKKVECPMTESVLYKASKAKLALEEGASEVVEEPPAKRRKKNQKQALPAAVEEEFNLVIAVPKKGPRHVMWMECCCRALMLPLAGLGEDQIKFDEVGSLLRVACRFCFAGEVVHNFVCYKGWSKLRKTLRAEVISKHAQAFASTILQSYLIRRLRNAYGMFPT